MGRIVYMDEEDEGQDKWMGRIVYMDKEDEGMQWGRISGWDGWCTWIRRMLRYSGAG
jgi:hypothetical protein